MPGAIACLINADAPEAAQTVSHIRLNSAMGCVDAVANGAPVDAKIGSDGSLSHLADHPGYLIVEILREAAGTVRPGDVFIQRTVLKAVNPLWAIGYEYRNTVEIRCSPMASGLVLAPIANTLLLADGAKALLTLKWPGMDDNVFLLSNLPKLGYWHFEALQRFNMYVLEIYDGFQYTKR